MRTLILAAAIALLPLAAFAQDVTVVGLDGRTKVFTPKDLADLPRAKAELTMGGKVHVYEGPLVSYMLREVGAPSGARMHAAAMRQYLAAIGEDGYLAVYALAEVDKDFRDGAVILADTVDGAKLGEKQGPYRVVASGDKKPSRSVFRAVRLEIRKAQ